MRLRMFIAGCRLAAGLQALGALLAAAACTEPHAFPSGATEPNLVEASLASRMAGHLVVWNAADERVVEGDIGYGSRDEVRLLLPPESYGASVELVNRMVSTGIGPTEEVAVRMLLPQDAYTYSFDALSSEPPVECAAGTRAYYYSEPRSLPVWRVGSSDRRETILFVHVEMDPDRQPACTWECR